PHVDDVHRDARVRVRPDGVAPRRERTNEASLHVLQTPFELANENVDVFVARYDERELGAELGHRRIDREDLEPNGRVDRPESVRSGTKKPPGPTVAVQHPALARCDR